MTQQDHGVAPRNAVPEDVPPALLERDREMTRARELIAAACSGQGRLLCIEGPAGIGKTRLLHTIQALARENGMAVLSARGGELERGFPYGAVRQLFEPRLKSMAAAEQSSVLEGPARLAADLLRLPGASPDSSGDRRSTPVGDPTFSVLHGLYWLCADLAAGQPMLLSVDDAHWSDDASLRFLLYLIRRISELRLLLVLTTWAGDDVPNRALLWELASDALAETLALSPLSAGAVARLVRGTLSDDADETFCRACHTATGGNPFLLHELVSSLREQDVPPTSAGSGLVPEMSPVGIAHAVFVRLRRLPREAAGLARAAALLGAGADLRHAAALADLDETAAQQAADALVGSEILVPGRPLDFVHPIVRTSIHAGLRAGERSLGHGRAARLLAAEGAPSVAVAGHLLSTEPRGDAWVVDVLRDAAAKALAEGAPEPAVAFLRRALSEPPEPAVRGDVLRELGSAEHRIGMGEGIPHLRQAFDTTWDPSARASAGRELALALVQSGRIAEAVGVLDDVISTIGPSDRELTLALEAELISAAVLEASTTAVARERISRLRGPIEGRTPGERLLLANLALRSSIDGGPADVAADLAERALAGGRLLVEQKPDSMPYYQAVYVLILAERFDPAQHYLDQALADAQTRGSLLGFSIASNYRAYLAYRRGSVPDAEAEAAAAVETALRIDWTFGLPAALAVLVDALVEKGDVRGAATALERYGVAAELPDGAAYRFLLQSRGLLRLAEGNPGAALEDLLELARRQEKWRVTPPHASPYQAGVALAWVMLGERARGVSCARDNLEIARAWGSPRAVGMALRTLGLAEGGEGGLDLLDRAVTVLEESSARLEHARALVDLGGALRRAGRRSDARKRLRRGLDLAYRSGAAALARRASEELRASGARPRRPAMSGLEALTATERRVADMAAAGLTNRRIAQALFVTTKTIEVHLTHTYQKLGIRSRDDLRVALSAEPSNQEVPT